MVPPDGAAPPKDPRELRFDPEMLDPGLAADIGAAFQDFCFELIRERRPGLQWFPAAGKDGGIDLIDDGERGRTVFECKYVGDDGLESARARWRATAKTLARHLPARSQKQYSPWWEQNPPIREYCFCIASVLSNQSQVEALEREIETAFHQLARDHQHLSHLGDIRVTVLDWRSLLSDLKRAPGLLFRWFRHTRPLGLVPVERSSPKSLFSSFLSGATLGYYSRAHHISEYGHPQSGDIESELQILGRLSDTLGLIVTGAGGLGKTRLVQELGLLAQTQGSCVLRIAGGWRRQSLEQLGSIVGSSARVLLLLDYLEMQQGFDDAVNDLLAMRETYGLQMGYVANCRSSFYHRVAHLPQHEEVPLAPEPDGEWFRNYRHYVVRHILASGEVGANSDALEVCRDVPVLAVFLVYLANAGRDEDLRQLLAERDFGAWVRRRLKISFPGAEGDVLPELIARFPVRESVAAKLRPVKVLSTLEQDGWIEQETVPGDRRWVFIHDVLADQVLLSWLTELGSFAGAKVEELVVSALADGTLASVIAALQRIRDHPDVEHIPLSAVIRNKFGQDPDAWMAQVPEILGSSLLSPTDTIAILESNSSLWQKQLGRSGVCQHIGWLAREVSVRRDAENAAIALTWLKRALAVEETDYLLRSALYLDPAWVADRAKVWIDSHPTDFSTQFVITAWLAAGLQLETILPSVLRWLNAHCDHPRARYVLMRLLSAGYDLEQIEPLVLRWLESNSVLRDGGSQVLLSWLKRGGSRATIDAHVVTWLEANVSAPEVNSVVLGRWIEAGADIDQAKPFVEGWLDHDGNQLVDRFVYLSWLNHGGSAAIIRDRLDAWLETQAGTGDIWYVMDLFVRELPKTPEVAAAIFDRWGGNPDEKSFGEVLHGWLVSGGEPDLVKPGLDAWLANFGEDLEAGEIYAALLQHGNVSAATKEMALRWFVAFPSDLMAGHIAKALAFDGALTLDALRAILKWCAAFPRDEDALWRLTQVGSNLQRVEVCEVVLTASEAVSRAVLGDEELSALRATQLTTLSGLLASGGGLQTGIGGNRCDGILLDYVRHPSSFMHGDTALRHAQRPHLVGRIFSLVLRGWLDPDAPADADALERLLRWVELWNEPERSRAFRYVYDVAAAR